ncbi:HD superfamily hydrolase [Aspergillus sp. HF37]|nr:HD superfamily hydrolase [Aspergillus sp. HF37]
MASQSPASMQALLDNITAHVKAQMGAHDPSHDFAHVQRVLALSQRLLERERALNPDTIYDENAIKLAALLHDLDDRKYAPRANQPAEGVVKALLLSHGASATLAEKVHQITAHVSYSTEKSNPAKVSDLIASRGLVELAIVQDADRLDALGAVGIGRCFTFLGARGSEFLDGAEWELGNAIAHFRAKLERLQGSMKTAAGREVAGERARRVRVFREWWEDEVGV